MRADDLVQSTSSRTAPELPRSGCRRRPAAAAGMTTSSSSSSARQSLWREPLALWHSSASQPQPGHTSSGRARVGRRLRQVPRWPASRGGRPAPWRRPGRSTADGRGSRPGSGRASNRYQRRRSAGGGSVHMACSAAYGTEGGKAGGAPTSSPNGRQRCSAGTARPMAAATTAITPAPTSIHVGLTA